MTMLRLFAAARQVAGVERADMTAATVGELLAKASARWGAAFDQVLAVSQVWVNGEPADSARQLGEGDEVAVLPPFSGGCAGVHPAGWEPVS